MATTEEILARDFPKKSISLMKNRILISHHKYGWMSQTCPELTQAVKPIQERLDLYLKAGNTGWLVDVANFAMLEWKHSSLSSAHFKATDSAESPGLTGGISYNEMIAELD